MLFNKEKETTGTHKLEKAADAVDREAKEMGHSCQNCKCEERAKKTVEAVFSELLKNSIVVESPNSKGEFIEVVRMSDVYRYLCVENGIDALSTIYGEEWA